MDAHSFLDLELLSEVSTETEFIRARIFNADERPSPAAELGTVPFELAMNPNRMSPAGVPMFYAAYDEAAAVLETYQPDNDGQHEIALARFQPVRPLRKCPAREPRETPCPRLCLPRLWP